jgi:hypothetical protein
MLPLAVESAIAPPFPESEVDWSIPAVVLIAPVPPVTERLISPPMPDDDENEYREPVVMLPPVVERAIAPPFFKLDWESRTPSLVLMEPVPPVTERVILPPLPPKEADRGQIASSNVTARS